MVTGLLEGITHTGEPVILDWWAKTNRNANRLIVAPSGAGKSFKAKLDIIRARSFVQSKRQGCGKRPRIGLPDTHCRH